MALTADTMKVELEVEACAVCGEVGEELLSPEEHDANSPSGEPPLRAVLLHLNHTKTIPSGRFCPHCIRKALDAYQFSAALSSRGPPPLTEKIRALRKRLHELTQKIDVFIVVGGANGAYNENDIIMVEKEALAAATKADSQELLRAKSLKGEPCYQCTVCPLSFQRASEFRSHLESHGSEAVHSCWTCGAQFTSHDAAREHQTEHTGAAAGCSTCSVTFNSESESLAHSASCGARCPAAALQRGARHFLCGYDGCILRFATRPSLLAHLRKCHVSSPAPEPVPAAPAPAAVRCDVCSRTFASAAAMKRHARVHKGERALTKQEKMEWSGAEEDLEGRVEYLEVETLEDLDEAEMDA